MIDLCCNNPIYVKIGNKYNSNESIWRCYSCGKLFHDCDDGHFGIYEAKPEDNIVLSPIEQERDALKKELEGIKSEKRNPLEIGCWDDVVLDDGTTLRDLYFPVFNEDKYKDVFPVLLKEIEHSCEKYPRPDNTVLALLEEVGEFAEENVETKRNGGNHELIQIACVALRLYVEGDPVYDPENVGEVAEMAERAIKLGEDARRYLIGIGFPE